MSDPPPQTQGSTPPESSGPLSPPRRGRLASKLNRVGEIVRLLREPIDMSTESGRSKARYKRAAVTAVSSIFARAMNVAVSLISVPLTIGYLGADRFGLWMTLSSAIVFLNYSDLGIGTGLQNRLSECDGKEDTQRPRELLSTAIVTLSGVFVLGVLAAVFLLPSLPLEKLIKVATPEAADELLPTAQAMLVVFIGGLPLSMMQRACNAYQVGFIANLWMAVGRLVSLALLLVVIYAQGGLPWLATAMMAPPLVTVALGGGWWLCRKRPWLVPSPRAFRFDAIQDILHIGVRAFMTEFGWMILASAPALVIANRLDTTAVTPYAVTHRLVGVSSILIGAALQPLWPAYTEALARQSGQWVRRTVGRSIKLVMAVQGPVFAATALLGQPIIRLWAGDEAVPAYWVLLGVNVWFLFGAFDASLRMLLNGASRFGSRILSLFVNGFPAAALAVWVAPTWGVVGVVWCFTLGVYGVRLVLMSLDARALMKTLPQRPPPGDAPKSDAVASA